MPFGFFGSLFMKIKVKKLNPAATLPAYAHPGDVGLDLYSLENYELKPGERRVFNLGFAMEFPTGYVGRIADKSSLPKNGGLHTMGGIFDAGYRGEYNVMLVNLGAEPYQIEKGHKIAQILIIPVEIVDIEETDALSETARGLGGFGSTGK